MIDLFPMPEDVAYELSRVDLDFETYEVMPIYDVYSRERGHLVGREVYRTCKHCGEPDLRLDETKHGWRLTYAAGKLQGKIHACPSEAR